MKATKNVDGHAKVSQVGKTPRMKKKNTFQCKEICIARCRQMATNMGISGFAEEVPPRGMPRPPQWNSFYSQQGIEGAADVNYFKE